MIKDLVNESIYARKIILIDEAGVKVGEVFRNDALIKAKNVGLDLVQIYNDERSGLPVCKILDYGKMKYEKSKIKAQKPPKEKEVIFHLNTSSHDLETKTNHVKEFLKKGCRVKFGIEMRRREKQQINTAREIMKKQVANFSGLCKFDDIKESDNSVFVLLLPNK